MLAHLMRSGKSVATDSSESDCVVLVKKDVDRAREFFSEATFSMSMCVVLPVSCLLSQKALLPVETCP